LESKDTRIIGFLAKKHTTETHIGRFGDYLQGLLPRAVPEFVAEHFTASIENGIKAKMTTEVIAIRTATEDADEVDKRFKQRFPANTNDGEYYVSYMSKIDDVTMRGIYKKQNTWNSFPLEVSRILTRKWKSDLQNRYPYVNLCGVNRQ